MILSWRSPLLSGLGCGDGERGGRTRKRGVRHALPIPPDLGLRFTCQGLTAWSWWAGTWVERMIPRCVKGRRSPLGRREVAWGRRQKLVGWRAARKCTLCRHSVIQVGPRMSFRAWLFPPTRRPEGGPGGTATLSRTVWVGGAIVLNANSSKTLEDFANPGVANNEMFFFLSFPFSFLSCQSEGILCLPWCFN